MKTEEISSLGGHVFVQVVDTKPDCTHTGEKSYNCIRCGEKLTEIYPALGHDYEDQIVEPTCLDAGYTLHTCSRCEESYQDAEVEALGHQFGDPVETKAPGPDGPGTLVYTCLRCEVTEEKEEYLTYDLLIREEGVIINMLMIDQAVRGWDPYLKNIPDTVKGQMGERIDYSQGMNCYDLIDPDYQGKLFGAYRLDEDGNLLLDQPISGTYVWKDGEKALSELKTGNYEVHFIPDDKCYQEADFVIPFELRRWVELKFYIDDEANENHYGYVGSSRHYEGQLVDLKRWENIMLLRVSYLGSSGTDYEDSRFFGMLYRQLAERIDANGTNLNHCYADDEVNLVWHEDGYLTVPEEDVWIHYGLHDLSVEDEEP